MPRLPSRSTGPRMAAPIAAAVLAAAAPATAASTPPPDFRHLSPAPLAPDTAPHSHAAARAMLSVPAGAYVLGREDGPVDERPRHRVELGAFRIDRTEVTNAAFAEYLNALDLRVLEPFEGGEARPRRVAPEEAGLLLEGREGSGAYPIIALDDDQARIGHGEGAFRPTPGFGDHPVTETTWAGARAYCRWRGGDLPTEAEWEAAARGPEAALYPWGARAPDRMRAFVSRRTGQTAPVGGRPEGASPVGALDMSGSLAEWTSSLKRPYPYRAEDGREDPDAPGERVTRGGDYRYDTSAATLTATHRDGFSNAPARGHRHIGFRCVVRGR